MRMKNKTDINGLMYYTKGIKSKGNSVKIEGLP